MIIGGDIIEITANNTELGSSYTFATPTEEEATINMGGLVSTVTTTADGRSIRSMKQTPWSVATGITWDMLGIDDLDALSKLAASKVDTDFTFTHISGAVFAGKGTPVDSLEGSAKDAKIPVTFSGGGKLKQI